MQNHIARRDGLDTIWPMHEKLVAMGRLQQIVETLRGPNGCPWDKVQTLSTVSRYLLEESCEVQDAVDDAGSMPTPAVCEELGDTLVNLLLAAQISEDSGGFDIADVARTASVKLVRRHPHVFAGTRVDGVDEVLSNWSAIKAMEKQGHSATGALESPTSRPSRLDGVPRSLPPLERALELGKKASKAGFDWPSADGALEKVAEELGEVREKLSRTQESPPGESQNGLKEELGDLLLAVVNVCRKTNVRPEEALRGAIRKFCARFRQIEAQIPSLETASLEAMEEAWQASKGIPEGKELPGIQLQEEAAPEGSVS